MMSKQFILKGLLAVAVTLSLFSCDKDFNTIGSDIVGDDYLNFDKHEFTGLQSGYDVTNAVQSNNLPLNSFGIYHNPAFGTAKSSFVTQAELSGVSPTIGINPQIDSVWVYVPYFNTWDGSMEDDNVYRKYTLDSIYGDEIKFKLKIYENGYKLGEFDPNTSDGILRHFSDERATKVEPYKKGTNALGDVVVDGDPLNKTIVAAQYEQFYFSNKEHIFFRRNQNGQFKNSSGAVIPNTDPLTNRVVVERFSPGMWINLNKEYFRKRILNAPADKLANQTAFKDYFRGLFFEAEANGDGRGAMAMLDFTKGYVQIEYSYGVEDDHDDDPNTPPIVETQRSSLKLNLKGNTINFFDNDYNPFDAADRLYVVGGGKGATGSGNGSTAFIDVFGTDDANANGIPDELDYIRAQGWLINEANLTFYVDDTKVDDSEATNSSRPSKQKAPFRLYLYDSKNSKPVVDYSADITTSPLGSKYNKYIYGGLLEKKDGKGYRYKFRITEYLRSCIKNTDSTNFRLRLAASQNIHNINNAYLKNPVGSPQVKFSPVSSVIYPLGTILHSPSSENTEKRLKLEIYYTKPE